MSRPFIPLRNPFNRIARSAALLFTLLVLLPTTSARAGGAHLYYRVLLKDLKFSDGQLPEAASNPPVDPVPARAQMMEPWVQVDGGARTDGAEGAGGSDAAEGYMDFHGGFWNGYDGSSKKEVDAVVIRAEPGKDVTGRLFVADKDWKQMTALKFTIPQKSAEDGAREPFYKAKVAHYQSLLNRQVPGAAWFRHQASEARLALGDKAADLLANNNWPGANQSNDLESTYNLFTGGRALSENLQLDRVMPSRVGRGAGQGADEQPTVPLDSIKGLTVKEMDWKEKIKDKKPQLDPLAALIPIDQHAVFFPTFEAMTAVVDAADAEGVPVLQLAEPRAEDAGTREKYQKQLCLSLSGIGRLLGPQVISSVAFTGSDPYLRTGSDVAMLLEPKDAANPDNLKNLLSAQVSLNRQRSPDARPVEGKVGAVEYFGARSPDRSVCVYVAQVGPAVVVTNSLKQLEQLVETQAGRSASLASAPEYLFFRDRYPRGDAAKGGESALVVLTDATIRRWCGPRWRIADSRRTRAAAVLAELQADRMDDLVRKDVTSAVLHTDRPLPDAGELRLTTAGASSSTYGSLEFLTPIVELPMEKVTRAEADTYNRWRDGYQQNWSNFFDPIALRLSIKGGKMAADLTVMPLIIGSEYREYVQLTEGANLRPDAGDPHDALLHVVMALNHKSQPMQQMSGMLSGVGGDRFKIDPLGWVGDSVAVYVDNDEAFWTGAAKAEDAEKYFEDHLGEIPVALCVQSKNVFKLAAFVTGIHAFVDQSVPGLTLWEPLKYRDQDYVKIGPTDKGKEAMKGLGGLHDLAIYYAATPDFLLVTPGEFVMKKAMDRQADRESAKAKPPQGDAKVPEKAPEAAEPWLGASLAAREEGQFLSVLRGLYGREYQLQMQTIAWGDLPILNEYKRLFPDQDPVKLHERLWHTKLIDPAGGSYVWDEQYQTMASTHFGHPGAPKEGPPLPPQLEGFVKAAFGVTFEEQGLRARAELDRKGR